MPVGHTSAPWWLGEGRATGSPPPREQVLHMSREPWAGGGQRGVCLPGRVGVWGGHCGLQSCAPLRAFMTRDVRTGVPGLQGLPHSGAQEVKCQCYVLQRALSLFRGKGISGVKAKEDLCIHKGRPTPRTNAGAVPAGRLCLSRNPIIVLIIRTHVRGLHLFLH